MKTSFRSEREERHKLHIVRAATPWVLMVYASLNFGLYVQMNKAHRCVIVSFAESVSGFGHVCASRLTEQADIHEHVYTTDVL